MTKVLRIFWYRLLVNIQDIYCDEVEQER
jgi:hypothetical protein